MAGERKIILQRSNEVSSDIMNELGFKLYLVFTASWYLHLASRIPLLGHVHIDLLLAFLLIILTFISRADSARMKNSEIDKILKILIIYAFITFPISEWPGTVIKAGFPDFIKSIVFYYFTVSFVTSERKLKILLFLYLACQTFRVLEPLYLHITQGYWGSAASMLEGAEYMMRLAGAPADGVNSNGLAVVIFSIIPFLYFYSVLSWKNKAALIILLPPLLYAMALTGSRSGLIGLGVALMGIVYKSSRKVIIIPLIVLGAIFLFVNLSPDQQDRYLSLINPDTKHGSTVHTRITGIKDNFELFIKRPVFGFGLGTAQEANYNYGTSVQPPHNLYLDVGIQLGLVGVIIFIFFMKAIVMNFMSSYKLMKQGLKEHLFLIRTIEALQILIVVEIVFSFASYGLLIPSWYFLAGLSSVLLRLATQATMERHSET